MTTIVKLPEMLEMIKCSKSKVYSEIKKGHFPKPIKLGDRAVAWVLEDVREWLDQRIKHSKGEKAA
ncbi:AlpA family phage regulatory protein [Rheinheimera baltica]|uniref:AlpA family phage regulatory protein n=1 Tax=Rheinheimera baltica TaxID=67576 RepID=A0ABT9I3H3_9GAMM|nr:AlpA family phage regulatory protein [Rheinheimera baltica]MDP5137930.1 AlpA family phage regulatory protein [Rheinheimera baltica]MDP5149924.1 AlpA family phage regulatory protein [Rheinheimera baltica]